MTRRWLSATAALLLSSPWTAPAQGLQPPDTTTLAQAGVRFPERLGRFERMSSTVQAETIQARYQLSRENPRLGLIDIFLARAEAAPDAELAFTETVIRRLFPDLAELRPLSGPPGVRGATGRLWSATFDGERVVTGLLLWHHNGWRIKVRATMLAPEGEGGWSDIEAAIAALGMPSTAALSVRPGLPAISPRA